MWYGVTMHQFRSTCILLHTTWQFPAVTNHNFCLLNNNIPAFAMTHLPHIPIMIWAIILKKKKISHRQLGLLHGSRRGLNPIKLVCDPDWLDGRLNLTASPFNQLGQYTSSPGHRATAIQNSPFSSLAVAVTIAGTHCTYPRRDGQAELAWVAGYVVREFTSPKTVTHPSTNQAQCWATALIKTNALLLH